MNKFFTPDDFPTVKVGGIIDKFVYKSDAAQIANAKLERLIESWPAAYANPDYDDTLFDWQIDSYPNATHKARLAFIEPLLREPCKHEPVWESKSAILPGLISPTAFPTARCSKCNVELIATWSAK